MLRTPMTFAVLAFALVAGTAALAATTGATGTAPSTPTGTMPIGTSNAGAYVGTSAPPDSMPPVEDVTVPGEINPDPDSNMHSSTHSTPH